MHEDMQVSSKKPVSGAFYSRGSRLVKFPWQSSNFCNSQKKGPIMHPDPLFKNFGKWAKLLCVTELFLAI